MKAKVSPILTKKSVVEIAKLLLEGPGTPVSMANRLGFSQGHVSNLLALLKSHGLVQVTPCGRNRIYGLSKEGGPHVRKEIGELAP